jgi:hypothetical protein
MSFKPHPCPSSKERGVKLKHNWIFFPSPKGEGAGGEGIMKAFNKNTIM